MPRTVIELTLAPTLVAVCTLVVRRWGSRAGGVVSAFPAIVGPVLLILALSHGRSFAAHAAGGILLGLVSLAAFALAYGRMALRFGWRASLIAGWLAAGLAGLTAGLAGAGAGSLVALLLAAGALALAHRALPATPPAPLTPGSRRGTTALRMGTVAVLVVLLSAAAGALGPLIGGMLAALPVLACVLAVFTHREQGACAVVALLRGMLAGMASFVAFCELIALLIGPAGIGSAFGVATVAALALQGAAVYAPSAVHSTLRRQSSPASVAVAAAAGSLRRQSS